MALRTLVRRNNNGKIPVTMQCHNLHSFIKQGVILISQIPLKSDKYHIHLAQFSLQSPLLLNGQTITNKLILTGNLNNFLPRFEKKTTK